MMSPAGSPSGAAGQMDGLELAKRMMMATEAASTAASSGAKDMMKRVGARHCPSLEFFILRVEKRNCRCGVTLHGQWNNT